MFNDELHEFSLRSAQASARGFASHGIGIQLIYFRDTWCSFFLHELNVCDKRKLTSEIAIVKCARTEIVSASASHSNGKHTRR